ncbi:hypothetical protein GWI33_006129 [Rhynchophorus ferrugineus]|uniref:Aminopeptidase n=1 Tax=Rhynchophorus ferrugineus TaxID=354439 RepID=A0A834IKX6_RHYFE|nr:hypothetical protein GWI33_006129 [Rhynchophorus ferrugineus]
MYFKCLLLVVSYFLHVDSVPLKAIQDEPTSNSYRLTKNVGEIKYTLTLTFPEETLTGTGDSFSGTVSISFKVTEDIQELNLHVNTDYIEITSLKFQNYLNFAYTVDDTTNILSLLDLDEIGGIKKGYTYTLIIEYSGKVSTSDAYGIYKRSFKNASNQTEYVIATQFEPYHARRAFPCFDEPSFKGTFDVTFNIPSDLNLNILMNTQVSSTENGVIKFEPTPEMSSYLLAFVISSFTSTSGGNIEGSNIPYNVWSRSGTESHRTYAVEKGPDIFKKLIDYMDYQYSNDMTKMDQVAIPDFSAGAMENWGLIIYSERALLWNSEQSSLQDKQRVATTIAHELAHQWFGNLITCDWWSVTFLNEGFATYFEYFILNEVETAWELDKQFVVSIIQPVMELDSWEYSKALQSETNTQSEISDKFGQISYYKGGSIIRMVSHIMGLSDFKSGIQSYVNSEGLQHSTAIPSQLWTILGEKVDTSYSQLPGTFSEVMQNWIEKPGYPLLTVTLSNNELTVKQQNFHYDNSSNDAKWNVPIFLVDSTTSSNPSTQPNTWLKTSDTDVKIILAENADWVLLNTDQAGYYRVSYDDDLWTKITNALTKDDFGGISALSRSGLVDDLFNLARAKKIPYSTVFSRLDFLKKDVSYYSWVPAFKGFNYINQKVEDGTDLKEALKNHILSLLDALYKDSPLSLSEANSHIKAFTKVLASSWACGLGHEGCLQEANSLFKEYKNNQVIDQDIRSVVFCNALRYSKDSTDYDFMWTAYNNANSANEQSTILTALGCITDKSILKDYLQETIKNTDESRIQYQDVFTVFSAVYSGSLIGVDVALDFFRDNYDAIVEKYTPVNYQSKLLKGIAEKLTTQEQINKLNNIISTHSIYSEELKDAAQEALTSANSNLQWIKEHETDLLNYYGINDDDDGGDNNGGKPNNAVISTINKFILLLTSSILTLQYVI